MIMSHSSFCEPANFGSVCDIQEYDAVVRRFGEHCLSLVAVQLPRCIVPELRTQLNPTVDI